MGKGRFKISSSFRIAVIFLIFGLSWVFFTDSLSHQFAGADMKLFKIIQNSKGALFMVLAAILIYFTSNRYLRILNQRNKELIKANQTLSELYASARQKDSEIKVAYDRFYTISQATGDAIWEFDLQTGSSYANEALKELLGFSDEELTNNFMWWRNNLHPDDKVRMLTATEKAIKGNQSIWSDEYRIRCKDGNYKVVFDRAYIVRNEEGKAIRLVGAMQDVTNERKLQKELVDEKVNRQKEIAQAVIRAQEAEKEQLGEELHDNINQLLATTKLYLEHSLQHSDTREEFVRRSLENVVIIIEEIRKLSRTLAPPSLGEIGLVEGIIDLVNNISSARQLEFDLDLNSFREDQVSHDKKLSLYRIVQEQLNNILKHSGADKVRISLNMKNEEMVLLVADNGVGFDPGRVKYGLGLRNIKNRTELYNGTIQIKSAPGQGCKLEVRMAI
ncbi:MAG TPA: PAS domain-containing protein [Parasegetibacter sp.]